MLSKALTQVFDRARVRFGVEIYILDVALSPIYPEGDAEFRDVLTNTPRLRQTLADALAGGRSDRVQVDGANFDVVALRANGSRKALGLVSAEAGEAGQPRHGADFWVDFVKAVWDANAATSDALNQEREHGRRLVAMLRFLQHLVETDTESELARSLIQAAAVWFDVDARIYQRDLGGDFSLYASLPGAAVEESAQTLPASWVSSAPAVRRVAPPGAWLLRSGAHLMVLPLASGGATEWVLALIGPAPETDVDLLPTVGRIAGSHIELLRARRRDRARELFGELIQQPGAAPELVAVQVVRELASLAHASAASLTLNRRGHVRRLASVGPAVQAGPLAVSDDEDWSFTPAAFSCALRLGEGVSARLELRGAPDQPLTSDAALLTRVAAAALQTWLCGAEPGFVDAPLLVPAADRGNDTFVRRIEEELDRAKRFDLRLSLVVVDVPRQAENSDLAERLHHALRRELRGSDVLGRMDGDRVVVLLTHTDESGSTRVVERLRRRLAESAARNNLAGLTLGYAAYSPDCTTAHAMLSRAMRDAERVAV